MHAPPGKRPLYRQMGSAIIHLSTMLFLIPLLALAVQEAQPAAHGTTTPSDRTVALTVFATDRRGNTVGDLKRDDFTLRDDGAPRPIDAVEFRRARGRLFAFFFDEYHIEPGVSTERAREALARFVAERLRPEDRVIVMKPLDSLTSIQPSPDHELTRGIIARFSGCKGDYTPRTPFETEYMSRAPETAAIERTRVVVSDLQALAVRLSSEPDAAKAIIYIGEGPADDLRAVARAANRAGVPVYAVDPRTNGDESAALRALAEETGGTATSTLLVQQGLDNVAKDLDGYYVLTYRTAAADGRFHALEVSTARRNVQTRSRRGYWAPAPPLRRPATAAPGFGFNDMLSAHASKLIRPWFRMERGPEGRTRIVFSWEPNAGPNAKSAPELLQMTAATPDGNAVFRGAVAPLSAASTGAAAPSRIVMDVPPGRLRTDMSIADAQARVLDRDVRFLDIPNLYGPGIIVMTPEILRSRTAREFRDLAQNEFAPPTSVREFNRFERLLVRVRAYGPGETPPEITATLVNAVGQRLLDIARVAEGTGTAQFDLPLSVLARGDYQIEIAVSADGSSSRRAVPIRVIG